MSKQLYVKLVGGLVVTVIIVGYIVSVYATKPTQVPPVDTGLGFEGNLITSETANKILQRRTVTNLPVNPPDSNTDNPFLALE